MILGAAPRSHQSDDENNYILPIILLISISKTLMHTDIFIVKKIKYL